MAKERSLTELLEKLGGTRAQVTVRRVPIDVSAMRGLPEKSSEEWNRHPPDFVAKGTKAEDPVTRAEGELLIGAEAMAKLSG